MFRSARWSFRWMSVSAIALALSGCNHALLCDSPANPAVERLARDTVIAPGIERRPAFDKAGVSEADAINESLLMIAARAKMAANFQARLLGKPQVSSAGRIAGQNTLQVNRDPGLDVLVLSGGGQLGAYGAGVLNGWTATSMRPEFDMVTGISTGALISTFAFLGTPVDDALLREQYRNTSNSDIFTTRSLLCLPWANSIADTKPLRGLLDRSLTADVIRRVAEEGQKGRQLWVGVVEFKTGKFIPINLTEIAAIGTEDSRQLYLELVLAAAAIPAVFPPVCECPFALVDGGARQNVFLPAVTGAIADAAGTQPVRVWVLMNNQLATPTKFNVESNLVSIASRAISLLFKEAQLGAVTRIYIESQRPNWQLRLTDIPLGSCVDSERSCSDSMVDQLCTEYMRCLYDVGFERAKSGTAFSPWKPE